MTDPLGRLTTVPAKEVWRHEARNFTPWLLANVDVLSDLLGMDLVLAEAEHPVGDFRLDLKGYDESTGEVVIVENQLDRSDHGHLGQIITYAAGTDPTTIVWITTGFRPEHRAAIDWLNQRTDEQTRVFGVVIRVVRIGDSPPAPNFELVAQPNDWEKQVKQANAPGPSLGGKAKVYGEFWEDVLARIRAVHPEWTRGRTSNSSWVNTGIGTSGAVISMAWVAGRLVAQVYFESSDGELNSSRFDHLHSHRTAFEAALGQPAVWDKMAERKGARIMVPSDFEDIDDRTAWPKISVWLIDQQVKLRQAISEVGGIRP